METPKMSIDPPIKNEGGILSMKRPVPSLIPNIKRGIRYRSNGQMSLRVVLLLKDIDKTVV